PGIKGKPLGELKPYVNAWHGRALPNIVNARDFIDEWEDFCESWGKVRYAKGEGAMVEVLERAKAAPDAAAIEEYESEKMGVLVALCRELQRDAGDQPFFLSSPLAGRLLEMKPMRAWRWLRLLCVDGPHGKPVLRLVKRGNQKDANEYQYLGELSQGSDVGPKPRGEI
ncbi:unnamed protein product, partial [marine sediment metagenome]